METFKSNCILVYVTSGLMYSIIIRKAVRFTKLEMLIIRYLFILFSNNCWKLFLCYCYSCLFDNFLFLQKCHLFRKYPSWQIFHIFLINKASSDCVLGQFNSLVLNFKIIPTLLASNKKTFSWFQKEINYGFV